MVVVVVGTLKGYDQLLNIVLDEAVENLRGAYIGESLGSPSSPPLPSPVLGILVCSRLYQS